MLRRYEELNNNVKKASPFCNNPAHKESHILKEKYRTDKEQLIADINNKVVSVFGQAREKYNDLQDKVHKISFIEEDCGKHKVASTTTKIVHSCPYCNKSLNDINSEMEAIYLKLNRGRIDRTKALEDAKKLYSACTTCPNLNKLWRKGGNVKQNVEETYKRIETFKK